MSGVLKKDEAVSLPEQICSNLREKIEIGEYKPGKKLGSIREFARYFDVSPVTIIKALDILENEELIERVPAKGVFISEKLKPHKKRLNACFAFPERSMFPSANANENWGLNYELYRGLFEGAQRSKINMQFIYFEDKPSEEVLNKQLAALNKYDFVIFPGQSQLIDLREASAAIRPTYCLSSHESEKDPVSQVIKIDYDRTNESKYLLDYLLKSLCKSAGAISPIDSELKRAELFLAGARSHGIRVSRSAWLQINKDAPDVIEKIKEYLLSRKHEFIFVDYTEIMPLVYEAAYQAGLTVGKDFILTAVASGMTFTGLFPRLSYFRIPRYEMGISLMENAEKIIRHGKKISLFPEMQLEFVKGHCYQKN
ncbi:MAG: GntR family transcriptional regulator [Lentisphaeria bacterium]|nr:GntR family transcriptional regulator [Lentisphaeria bacterium]